MTEAIITGVVAIVVCMINNYFQQRRAEAQNDKTMVQTSLGIMPGLILFIKEKPARF